MCVCVCVCVCEGICREHHTINTVGQFGIRCRKLQKIIIFLLTALGHRGKVSMASSSDPSDATENSPLKGNNGEELKGRKIFCCVVMPICVLIVLFLLLLPLIFIHDIQFR